jgi:hypothetical protein
MIVLVVFWGRGFIRALHKRKILAFFIKLNIAKAFDPIK